MKSLILTYLALIFLLCLTVGAAQLDLGNYALMVALVIAVLKTLCIAWVFMELRTSIPLIRLASGAAILWLLFFFILAATDTLSRPLMEGSTWR